MVWSRLLRLALALAATTAAIGSGQGLTGLTGVIRAHAGRRLLHQPAWGGSTPQAEGTSSSECQDRPVLDVYLVALQFGEGSPPASGRVQMQCSSSDGESWPRQTAHGA